MTFRKILHPTDFSPCSAAAFAVAEPREAAAALAGGRGVEAVEGVVTGRPRTNADNALAPAQFAGENGVRSRATHSRHHDWRDSLDRRRAGRWSRCTNCSANS